MKKYKLCIIAIILGFTMWGKSLYAQNNNSAMSITRQEGHALATKYTPKSAMVIEAEKGRILFSENENKTVDIASITKLMTTYLVYDAIKNGKITMNTTVIATKNDESISQLKELTNTKIVSGQSYKVEDLLKMHLLPSSNVASIMLAKLVSNNDLSRFVTKMNEKAKEWGMTHTTFTHPTGAKSALFNGLANVNGISNTAQNKSSAKDVLIMSYHLLNDYPEILNTTKIVTTTIGNEVINNTNYSLVGHKYGLDGVDGLKTGSSGEEGYSYVFTLNKNGFRIIGVVLGVGTYEDERGKDNRHIIGNALANYIYKQYSIQTIVNAGTYRVDNKNVTFHESFINLVGPNQHWDYKLENDEVVLQETLKSIIAPTTYRISQLKNNDKSQSKSYTLSKDMIIVTGVGIVLLFICYYSFKFAKKGKKK